MAVKYTEEQLNNVDKSFLIALLLNQQEQLESLTKELHDTNEKMQKLLEQLILSNQERFGRSSEKMKDTNQICFMEVDGNIIFFNEAEAVCDLTIEEPEDLVTKKTKQKEMYKTPFSQKSCTILLLETLGYTKHLHLVSCFIYRSTHIYCHHST